ncbi:hypothetical protein BHE74_00050594 [Ensete ventricosum]|nr:hypothetical protein BHE74_00050594 [Ensete ventricosum]
MFHPDVTQEWVGKGMIEAAKELDCSSAYIHLREPEKSEDKAEVPQCHRERDVDAVRAEISIKRGVN